MPFSILIHYHSLSSIITQPQKKFFRPFTRSASQTRVSITTLKQVIFNTIFNVGAQPVQVFKELKKNL